MIDSHKIWQQLVQSTKEIELYDLCKAFERSPKRSDLFSLTVGPIFLDYAKNLISEDIFNQLVALSEVAELPDAIQALFRGDSVNITQNRPALHMACRRPLNKHLMVDGQDVMVAVAKAKEKMAHIAETIRDRKWLGATNHAITDVVNIGIGGSDLGPKMVFEALKPFQNKAIRCHFLSSLDVKHFNEVTEHLNPATTLFIVASKSFTTEETLVNAARAKAWLSQHLGTDNLQKHFIAVTANADKAKAWGAGDNILPFWDWVGGRYSVWSAIGLPIAIQLGMAGFESFLQGAHEMDEHFVNAPLHQNMPVILALLGIWYHNFLKAATLAILPYDYGLRSFPDYLQQLDMESNGKSMTKDGKVTEYMTGPIIWGQAGTNGQHAFYQLMHQGTHLTPADFILIANAKTPDVQKENQSLLAHGFAQMEALLKGQIGKAPSEVMIGNQPSNLLLLKDLTPHTLGMLIALYEHKVYSQSVIWQINAFDQPGVELGKKLSKNVKVALEDKDSESGLSSTLSFGLKKLKAWT